MMKVPPARPKNNSVHEDKRWKNWVIDWVSGELVDMFGAEQNASNAHWAAKPDGGIYEFAVALAEGGGTNLLKAARPELAAILDRLPPPKRKPGKKPSENFRNAKRAVQLLPRIKAILKKQYGRKNLIDLSAEEISAKICGCHVATVEGLAKKSSKKSPPISMD